jgi:hypothetical protein
MSHDVVREVTTTFAQQAPDALPTALGGFFVQGIQTRK